MDRLTDVLDKVVIGRQSVHDRQLEVVGYELRFGSGGDPAAASPLTSDVVFGALTIGLDRLVGDKRLFCDADRDLLVGDSPLTLLPARTVVEVRPDLQRDEAVVSGVRRLARQGFDIALDDFRWDVGRADELLDHASIVKVDAAALQAGDLEELVARCRRFDVQLLADRVGSQTQLDALRAAGFDLFQGFALQRPTFSTGRPVTAVGDLSRLQRATGLLGQVLDFDEIEDILRTEPGLTYQVLRLASMGRPGETRRPVNSVREALVRAGSWRIQSWISLLLTRSDRGIASDAVVVALARARACELLAVVAGESGRTGFTAGMVSSFEQLLQIPATELASSLPLSDELREAAFGDTTPVARLVRDVADAQDGRLDPPRLARLPQAELDSALAAGLQWALEATDSFG